MPFVIWDRVHGSMTIGTTKDARDPTRSTDSRREMASSPNVVLISVAGQSRMTSTPCSGVARPQFLGEHIDINKLLLINIYFNRDLYYVVALYTNGHDRIGRFCSYQLNRASSLWTFLYVVTIINEHAHNFWGNMVPPKFPQSSPNVPPMFPQCSPNVPPMFPRSYASAPCCSLLYANLSNGTTARGGTSPDVVERQKSTQRLGTRLGERLVS